MTVLTAPTAPTAAPAIRATLSVLAVLMVLSWGVARYSLGRELLALSGRLDTTTMGR